MASVEQFNLLVEALGRANRRLQELEDVDYPTAAYKGFSASGESLAEVQEAIERTQAQVARLEARLAKMDEALDEDGR